jgi:subtilisin family serine protease
MREPRIVLRREPLNRVIHLGPASDETMTVLSAEVREAGTIDPHDDAVVAAAAPMPVCLFRPLAVRDASPGEAAWGVAMVGADASPLDGAGVTVAVLDTGIDRNHAAFQGVTIESRDFTGEGMEDDLAHGTHCAGTIVGRDVDGVRIGIARGVTRVLDGKVVGRNGSSTTQLVDGILWAVDRGAHVISLSVGIDFPNYQRRLMGLGFPAEVATSKALDAYRETVTLFDQLAGFVQTGTSLGRPAVLVAAAGNESRRDVDPRFSVSCGPPAVAAGFVSVGAVGRSDKGVAVAPFSNADPLVLAPGVDIVSAKRGGGLAVMSGTSMAAPHVAGVAALFAQKHLRSGRFDPVLVASQLQVLAAREPLGGGSGPGVVRAPQL